MSVGNERGESKRTCATHLLSAVVLPPGTVTSPPYESEGRARERVWWRRGSKTFIFVSDDGCATHWGLIYHSIRMIRHASCRLRLRCPWRFLCFVKQAVAALRC